MMIRRPRNPALVVTTAATDLPVDLEMLKKHLRQSQDLDDELIQFFALPTATEQTEKYLNRYLMPQVAELRLDRFPLTGFWLVADPVRAVNSVKYYDTDNAQQTWSSSNYETDLSTMQAFIRPVTGVSWPSTYDRLHAVTVEMNVGWANAEAIPHSIKYAVMMLAMHLYDNPSAVSEDKLVETPKGYEYLLNPHRIVPV